MHETLRCLKIRILKITVFLTLTFFESPCWCICLIDCVSLVISESEKFKNSRTSRLLAFLNNTKTVFVSTSALVNMESDDGDGPKQLPGWLILCPFSITGVFMGLVVAGSKLGTGPIFWSKLTLYIIYRHKISYNL